MNLKPFLFVLGCLLLFSASGFAQDNVHTLLKKNINPLADRLTEELSVSRDSLLLENDLLFSKIRFFNEEQKYDKTFYFKPAVKKGKIALTDLPLGSYSVMFYQIDRIIVFRVDRLSKFNNIIKTVDKIEDPAILADINFRPKAAAFKRADEKSLDPNQSSKFSDMAINASDFDLNTNAQNARPPGLMDTSTKGFGQSGDGDYDLASTGLSSKIIPMDSRFGTGSKGSQNGETFDSNSIYFESGRKGIQPYDLSNQDRDHVQTRDDYRSTHLRPNGKPYD
ncbi:hypothetical protein ESY86_16160 [Subsaximicrobium wynnwilliamsii]|uniref:DUF4138 domain-containing protein n=1 Tax=Subsaximicrobium wynnwilliamsii TaxID=291179 RepID=A0A5C6ZFJ7_9FLAO|nr:hypothetical protein [Subsaximicrobium wynnwilliamsii]TXD81744.1 hypothetical protein ESY87_16655 [Subsaximicrobium wynnwilliamsii]TXD87570.1 hypothetical protein ESY86_16160 [Subsaximicrobium wynnwilliamsii]TXE01243.1 hypothetical protein ESY88_16410 [Subsaximicrobium wynnwilliamsii]